MSRNDDNTTGNVLDYLYHQKFYKRIGVDLSRQTNTNIPRDDGAKMFFIAEKVILDFSWDSLIVTE